MASIKTKSTRSNASNLLFKKILEYSEQLQKNCESRNWMEPSVYIEYLWVCKYLRAGIRSIRNGLFLFTVVYFPAESSSSKMDLKHILDCMQELGPAFVYQNTSRVHLKPLRTQAESTAEDPEPMNKWHRMLSQNERDAVCAVFKFVDSDSRRVLNSYGIRDVMRILHLDTSGMRGLYTIHF